MKLWDGLEMFGVWNRWKKQKNIILLFTSQECAKINQNYRRYAKQKLFRDALKDAFSEQDNI